MGNPEELQKGTAEDLGKVYTFQLSTLWLEARLRQTRKVTDAELNSQFRTQPGIDALLAEPGVFSLAERSLLSKGLQKNPQERINWDEWVREFKAIASQ